STCWASPRRFLKPIRSLSNGMKSNGNHGLPMWQLIGFMTHYPRCSPVAELVSPDFASPISMIEPIFRGGLFCASQVYADVMEHHSMSLAQMKSYVAQLAVRS